MLNALFEKWDNDGSGYLDLDEVVDVMVKYKDGQEKEAITKGICFEEKSQWSVSICVVS